MVEEIMGFYSVFVSIFGENFCIYLWRDLCLYGYVYESWKVNLPPKEVPPDLPEPFLGINFARDGMKRKDWISMVVVHSDAWMVSVAFFHGNHFNQNERYLFSIYVFSASYLFSIYVFCASK
jgi:hypothetical protein